MATLPAAVTRKLGPLPAWAWGIGLGGAVLIYQRLTSAPEPPPDADAGEDDLAGAGLAAVPAFDPALGMSPSPLGGGGTWVPAPSVTPATPAPPAERWETNLEYRRAATDWAISEGFDAITASNAITKWLDGAKVTQAEAAVVRAVMREFGSPPQGAPALLVEEPKPTQNAPAAPATPAPAPKPATPAPAPKPAPKWEDTMPVLKLGDRSDYVRRLQTWLNKYAGQKIAVDGYYGPQTEAAVSNLLRFMNGGTRPSQAGASGVNKFTWGLISYISELNKHPKP